MAYGFTGYSFTTQQTSDILKEVRQCCKEYGLNVVVQCFDGAFAKLAVRGNDNEPLTLLQLSKDIWMEVCSMAKQEIVKKISLACRVCDVMTFKQLIEAVDVAYRLVETSKGVFFIGPIYIGYSHNMNRYSTPPNWRELLTDRKRARSNLATEDLDITEEVTSAVLQNP